MKNIITVLILVLAVLMTACDGDNGVSAASTTTYDQPTSSDGSEPVVTPSSSSEVVYPDPVPVKWSGYYGKICDKAMQFMDELTSSLPDMAMVRLETECPRSDIEYLKCSDLESIYQRIRRISIPYDALTTPDMNNGYVWFDFADLKAFVMIYPCEFE